MVRAIDDDHIEKILIRCPNWVGDLVMATPALKAVRKGFPSSHIAWLVKSYGRKVIDSLHDYDEILTYDEGMRDRGTGGLFSLAMRLRQEKIDLAVILPNSFSSALMVFLAGVRQRVGYSREGRGLLLTDPIEPVRNGSRIVPIHMVEYYLRITDALGCSRVTVTPELSVSPSAREKARAIFDRYGANGKQMTVVVIPGAAYGSSKCWKPESFAQVADQLIQKYETNLFVIPGPEEVDIAREIEARMRCRPSVLADPILPLDVLMAIIESCSLVITNDTGPRHFAAAFDKPAVVIMGPTDPRYTNLNLEKTVVLRAELDCSPCHLKTCPHDHQCMTRITPDQVIHAAERLVGQFVKANDGRPS